MYVQEKRMKKRSREPILNVVAELQPFSLVRRKQIRYVGREDYGGEMTCLKLAVVCPNKSDLE